MAGGHADHGLAFPAAGYQMSVTTVRFGAGGDPPKAGVGRVSSTNVAVRIPDPVGAGRLDGVVAAPSGEPGGSGGATGERRDDRGH